MKKVKIAVMVSGGGTNLQALIDAQNSGIINNGEIVLVLSNNANAYALTRALNAGIKTEVILKKDFNTALEFEKAIKKTLKENGVELIVLAGFMSILSEDFVKDYPERIINVHPSLIPSFCGAGFYGLRVHEEALKKGVKVTGATVHFVNEIPDGGKIIMQKAVKVNKNDTSISLQKRVMQLAEWKILPKATNLVCKKILMEK